MLGYKNQVTQMVLGTKAGTTYTPVTLESTYIAPGISGVLRSGGSSRVSFYIIYTVGTAETTNSIELKVEFSPDGTNWFRASNDSTSTGTSTLTQREFTFVGAAAGAYSLNLPITISDLFMRIAAKETGVAAAKGTVSIEATFSE